MINLSCLNKSRRGWKSKQMALNGAGKERFNRIKSFVPAKCCVCGVTVDNHTGLIFQAKLGVHFACQKFFKTPQIKSKVF